MASSFWDKFKIAGQQLATPPAQPDETDPSLLPNEQMAGQGLVNVFNAWNALQPDPIKLGQDGAGNDINWLPTVGGMQLKPGVNFSKYAEVMGGENPLSFDRKSLGKYVQSLGPDIRAKNSELIGAQLLDQFGTTDPQQAVANRVLDMGFSKDQVPPVSTDPSLGNFAMGSYRPGENTIQLNPQLQKWAASSQHPDAQVLGTVGHEAEHALNFLQNPNFSGRREIFVPNPRTNVALDSSGFMTPSRIEVILRSAKDDPKLFTQLPSFAQSALLDGHSPKAIAQLMSTTGMGRGEVGSIIRQAGGNRGFRGMDPALVDALQTQGHFSAPIKGEMDIPVYHLARQQAQAGGDVGAWEGAFPSMVQKARDTYQSTAVQGSGPIGSPSTPWDLPKQAGMGLGAAALMGGAQDSPTPNPSPTPTPHAPDLSKLKYGKASYNELMRLAPTSQWARDKLKGL